jgi:3'-phosphoadenosine 5'-phosphosulfate sulfotransferase (PAPS reductase)/FAD synthetase
VASGQFLEIPLASKPKRERYVRKPVDIDLDRLAMTPEAVARLTRPEREVRVRELITEAHALLDWGIKHHIKADGRALKAVVVLFSGGNDSTVLAHLFRDRASHAAHANTGVGIEQTREYVRATCARWDLPLIERKAPREEDSYREQVLAHGFPGPGRHARMFQRLKERALEQVRRELVRNPYRERVVYLAGRRRTESDRRNNVPEMERQGSIVWISPLVNWTKIDMNTYRLMAGDVPVNIVSDLIHMSGECLCGAFAHHGERQEISEWYADAFDEIAELEALIADRDDIPEHRKTWGWAGDSALVALSKEKPKSGRLCPVVRRALRAVGARAGRGGRGMDLPRFTPNSYCELPVRSPIRG